jgi:hypothetical protein
MNGIRSFEVWKNILWKDCAKHDKLEAFNGLGDYVLQVLYDSGIAPSVEAIADNGASGLTYPMLP